MLSNAYLVAKIGADTAENEQHFAEILPKIGNYPTGPPGLRGAGLRGRGRQGGGRARLRAVRARAGRGAPGDQSDTYDRREGGGGV